MHDHKILSSLVKSRKAWELVTPHLTLSELGTDTATLVDLISQYYGRSPSALAVDVEVLCSSVSRSFQNPKQVEMLQNILRNLPDTSPENVAVEVLALKRRNLELKLAAVLQNGVSNSKEGLNGSKKLLDEYMTLLQSTTLSQDSEESEVVEKFQVKDLVEKSFDTEKLIPIWPKQLTTFLGGGVRAGHHILVFAPTEMGKTLFLINALAGWVERKLPVLYVGNEDPVEDLMMRYITRLTQRTRMEVMAQPAKAQKRLEELGYEHVIFAPLAPGNFAAIQRLVSKFNPAVVVLDQLRNIDVDSENRTQALEKAATEARNLAKKNNLVVVSVSQAGDSASGKRTLTRGDVDGSNVGIPGQVDLMIGIGATEEDEKDNIRYLSFPKNKITGDHKTFMIRINPMLSTVIEPPESHYVPSS